MTDKTDANSFKPINPDYEPTKTLQQLTVEHPNWAGLQQLARAEAMAVATRAAQRIGVKTKTRH